MVNNCKVCAFLNFYEYTWTFLCEDCAKKESAKENNDDILRSIGPKDQQHILYAKEVPVDQPSVPNILLCNHANEVPVECSCGPGCYCRCWGSCRVKQEVKEEEKKTKKKKKKKVKKEYRYLGRFDNMKVDNDGTGD